MRRGPGMFVTVAVTMLGLLCTSGLMAATDPAVASATKLLQAATATRRDGLHHVLLRALRQLRDPALAPLFDTLARQSDAALRVHGLLGQVEASGGTIGSVSLAELKDPATQAELLAAALDEDLVTDDSLTELLSMGEVDIGVKIVAATRLVSRGKPTDAAVLREAVMGENIGRRGLAALLLMQMGDASAAPALEALIESDDPQREALWRLWLSTAIRYELDAITPLAIRLMDQPGESQRITTLAMRAVMRFDPAAAAPRWQRAYRESQDEAQRLRLLWAALGEARTMGASLGASPSAGEEELHRLIRLAAAAVASESDPVPAVSDLLVTHHPIAWQWAASYLENEATPEQRRGLTQAMFAQLAKAEQAPDPAQLFEQSVRAAAELAQQDPQAMVAVMRPILSATDTPVNVRQAALLGLLRGHDPVLAQAVDAQSRFNTTPAEAMALLLLARHGRELSPGQMADLSLVIRGGGNLPAAVRVQAAWLYLQRVGEAQRVLHELSP